jgi:hypothetical protein
MRAHNELWGTTMVYDGLFSSFRTRVSVDEEVNEAADICYHDMYAVLQINSVWTPEQLDDDSACN